MFRKECERLEPSVAYFRCIEAFPEAVFDRYNYPPIGEKYQLIRSENPGREPGEVTIDEDGEVEVATVQVGNFFKKKSCAKLICLNKKLCIFL